jgi:hypothetical protein
MFRCLLSSFAIHRVHRTFGHTNPRESSSVGRASASQAEGREFEPRFSLINNQALSSNAKCLIYFSASCICEIRV